MSEEKDSIVKIMQKRIDDVNTRFLEALSDENRVVVSSGSTAVDGAGTNLPSWPEITFSNARWESGQQSPTTRLLGQAAAEIAPRIAAVLGGTAKEWEERIVQRATDGAILPGATITFDNVRFEVQRRNFAAQVSGWTA